MFPDFCERSVEISHRNKIFTVSKLSIFQYSRVMKIINEADARMRTCHNDAEIMAISERTCKKIWMLLETSLPKKILRDRDIFNYNDLIELCIHLAFGSYLDDKIKESRQKYYESSVLPDYQFKAARILAQFSSYTLEKLLNEPASIFFALADYADRISADNAIELISEGVKAAFGNVEQLKVRRGSLTIQNPNCSKADISLEYRDELKVEN